MILTKALIAFENCYIVDSTVFEYNTDLRSKATLPICQNAADAVAASLCQYRLESKSV